MEATTMRELLADPQCWTQGALARNALGVSTSPRCSTACAWCLLGAARKIYGDWDDRPITKISRHVGNHHVPTWQDEPGRTHREILAVLTALEL